MPAPLIQYNKANEYGSRMYSKLQALRAAKDAFLQEFGVLVLTKDGDGSQASHFTLTTTLYGTADTTVAKAFYDELNSLNAAVVGAEAAIDQAALKLG